VIKVSFCPQTLDLPVVFCLLHAIFFVAFKIAVIHHPHHKCLFFSIFIINHWYYSMFYCPNPSCTRYAGKIKKPFSSDKSFSHHLQQSPACKVFLFVQQTSMSVPTTILSNPSKQGSHSSQLFKKQWLCFNSTFSQQQHSSKSETENVHNEALDAEFGTDTNISNFVFPDSFGYNESSGNFVDDSIPELPVETDYSCFTTSQ
jgi:hypothetical protein